MKKINCLLVMVVMLIATISIVAGLPDPDPVTARGFDTIGVFILFTIFIGSLYTFSKMHVSYAN